jgi:hypothetical protein
MHIIPASSSTIRCERILVAGGRICCAASSRNSIVRRNLAMQPGTQMCACGLSSSTKVRGGRQMLRRISLISIAALMAATVTAAAQQPLPPQPRGDDSRAAPTSPPPGPDATTGQRGATPPGKTGPDAQQSTPQEPRGDENVRSGTPSNQFLPPNPNEPRR